MDKRKEEYSTIQCSETVVLQNRILREKDPPPHCLRVLNIPNNAPVNNPPHFHFMLTRIMRDKNLPGFENVFKLSS